MNDQITTIEQAQDILKELEDAFYDIPFENSDYQNRAFVLAAQLTPARAYRALGLKLNSKLRAIDEFKFASLKEQVDLDEKQSIIEDQDTSTFAKRRAQIEIDQIYSNRRFTNKLLNDAIHELNVLYSEFKRYPSYTREQFESEEALHFDMKLRNQIAMQGNGSLESLHAAELLEQWQSVLQESADRLQVALPSIPQ